MFAVALVRVAAPHYLYVFFLLVCVGAATANKIKREYFCDRVGVRRRKTTYLPGLSCCPPTAPRNGASWRDARLAEEMIKFPPPWRGGLSLKVDEIPPKLHDWEGLRGSAT